MTKALVFLTSVLATLATAAAIVAVPAGIALLGQIERTLHAASYRPATFTVAWAAYRPGSERERPDYWAVGTVEGRRERLDLVDTMTVDGWEELEARVKPGQQMKVLYDPALARNAATPGARVIAYEDGFVSRQRSRLARTAALVYGPSLMLLAASLATGAAVRRRPSAATAATLAILLAGLVAVLFLGGAGGSASGTVGRESWRSVMTAVAAIAAGAIAVAVAVLLWHGLRDRKQREAALRRRAADIGFEFLGDAPDADREPETIGPFPLFAGNGRAQLANRMRGTANGYETLVCDCATGAPGETATWCTVARLGSLSLRLPAFTLSPRAPAASASEASPPPEGRVPGLDPRFSAHYAVHGADAEALRALFAEPAAAFFAGHEGWTVESLGDRVLVYRREEVVPAARLGAFVADVVRVAAVLQGQPS
jgi:hypothetical protein